jgi:hypothetical protein
MASEDGEQKGLLTLGNDSTEDEGFDAKESARNRLAAAVIFGILITAYLIIGAIYFGVQRGWDVIDCVYFSVLTLTTIGGS